MPAHLQAMDTNSRTRVPRGVTTGGQFTATNCPEPSVSLIDEVPGVVRAPAATDVSEPRTPVRLDPDQLSPAGKQRAIRRARGTWEMGR